MKRDDSDDSDDILLVVIDWCSILVILSLLTVHCENCDEKLKLIKNNQINELKLKAKETRDRFRNITLLSENLKRDFTLSELKKKLHLENTSSVHKYETLKPILGDDKLNKLRAINMNKSKDSTFILTFIRMLYDGQPELLVQKHFFIRLLRERLGERSAKYLHLFSRR